MTPPKDRQGEMHLKKTFLLFSHLTWRCCINAFFKIGEIARTVFLNQPQHRTLSVDTDSCQGPPLELVLEETV